MYHTPLTWKEQENLGNKSHFEALPRALWFCVYSRCNLDHKVSARRSYRPVHSSTKPKNSVLLSLPLQQRMWM